jgi:hypothetical protein
MTMYIIVIRKSLNFVSRAENGDRRALVLRTLCRPIRKTEVLPETSQVNNQISWATLVSKSIGFDPDQHEITIGTMRIQIRRSVPFIRL